MNERMDVFIIEDEENDFDDDFSSLGVSDSPVVQEFVVDNDKNQSGVSTTATTTEEPEVNSGVIEQKSEDNFANIKSSPLTSSKEDMYFDDIINSFEPAEEIDLFGSNDFEVSEDVAIDVPEQNKTEEIIESQDDIDSSSNSGVEIEESFDAIVFEDKDDTFTREIVNPIEDDFSDDSLSDAENDYGVAELHKKVKPILEKTTEQVVEDVKAQHDKMEQAVQEALTEDVNDRLSRYEEKKKRRIKKNRRRAVIKGAVAILVVLIAFGNAHIRKQTSLVMRDVSFMMSEALQGKEVSSNQLVLDLIGYIKTTEDKSGVELFEEDTEKDADAESN